MIRAVRFAARFGFRIEEQTIEAIATYASTLFPSVSMERIWQEFCKMAAYPHFDQAIIMLHRFGLLAVIFPQLNNVPLKTIEQYVSAFVYFPINSPTIVFLLELFPNLSLDERLGLCNYLKTTGKDRKLVEFFFSSTQLLKSPKPEPYEWAYFYAHSLSELFLSVQAAKLLPPIRYEFIQEHETGQKKLNQHIERIRKRRPLVTAAHLQKKGIPPGKRLGELLREAEKIAINQDLSDPNLVMTFLTDIEQS